MHSAIDGLYSPLNPRRLTDRIVPFIGLIYNKRIITPPRYRQARQMYLHLHSHPLDGRAASS